MKKQTHKIRSLLCCLLSATLLFSGTAIPAAAQERPVVISFGQPNIWSLEQAHYLLARMHRQNLDLQTEPLGNLDPNAANASRIEILKTLLEAGVKFDDAVRVNNRMLRRDKAFNSRRRQELLGRRSTLQAESTQLARDIAQLKSAKAATEDEAEGERLQAQIDARTEQKAAVDNELEQTNTELEGLSSASGSGEFQAADLSDLGSFNSERLEGDLDEIISQVQLVDPTIAASLRLENHIQMQYEIIAKQLTLLRDEVGPGERLVFLELPQSVSATQDRAENKVAQVWWRIAGYTRVRKEELLKAEVTALGDQISQVQLNVEENENLVAKNQASRVKLVRQLEELCAKKAEKERELERLTREKEEVERAKAAKHPSAIAADEALCKKLIHDIELLNDSIAQLDSAIAATREAIRRVDDQTARIQMERAKLAQTFTALTTKYEKLQIAQVRSTVRDRQDAVDRLLQGGRASTTDIVTKTMELLSGQSDSGGNQPGAFQKADYGNQKNERGQEYSMKGNGREYVNLDLAASSAGSLQRSRDGETVPNNWPIMRNRTVRTIDIIPRQNAVNVNDTKQRVSKTGIFAAFSFLFGFGGKFGYQRQREQAEQFLNQELFTSGFGKGETDFGWNFYPFASTKQLATGVRTTYAIAVIPEDAESLVLKSRGCYFPRKENQPLNYDVAGTSLWTDRNPKGGGCTPQEQVFVLPVPGGSDDGADFYVTEIRYSPHMKPGQRMVASIKGQNLPTQIGVLVNGVELTQSVGLAQSAIESILGDKVRENCSGEICGRFERIGPNQLVISFNMPAAFKATPKIVLIGPSRGVELNKLYLNVNGDDDTQLESAEWMFGDPPSEASRTIADFKVAPAPGFGMTGVLSGGKFKPTDTIYVNGYRAKGPGTPCQRLDLCLLPFPAQETDFLTVTVSPASEDEEAVSRTFVNPTTLGIISASVVSSEAGDADNPPVLTIKLDGSGFRNTLDVRANGVPVPDEMKLVTSAGQMILKITSPEPVVQITLTDPANNKSISTVIATPGG